MATRFSVLTPEDYKDDIVGERLGAAKRLRLQEVEDAKALVTALSEHAWALGAERQGTRVLVYCDRRKDALDVKKAIEALAGKEKIETQLLVGERRVHEREALFEWLSDAGVHRRPNGRKNNAGLPYRHLGRRGGRRFRCRSPRL